VVTKPIVESQVLGSTPSGSKFLRICGILAQIGLIEYSYQQVATSFSEAHLERTPKLSYNFFPEAHLERTPKLCLTRSEVRKKHMCEVHLEKNSKVKRSWLGRSAQKTHVLVCEDILELLESC
jgi:hypothetical protein